MKIGIITFHNADNYGALLQTYALQEFLNGIGHEVEIINYRCTAIENEYKYSYFPKCTINIFKWIIRLIKKIRVVNKKKVKGKKCSIFRDKYLNISNFSVATADDRRKIQNEYDLIITGSDQIWNYKLTLGKDDWYCFHKEINGGARIISYGASVGNLKDFSEVFEKYKNDLNSYSTVSVREEKTQEFLENKLQVPIYKVLDPTLVVDDKVWLTILSDNHFKIGPDYILYYDVEKNNIAKKIAERIAAEKKLKLIHYDTDFKMIFNGGYAEDKGPDEFLWLIINARYIVTSSFHATIFSIIFEKKFITVPHPVTGERVSDLLRMLDLEKRLITDISDFNLEEMYYEIDYMKIKQKLYMYKQNSIAFLSNNVLGANEHVNN